jgi:hypothetical protein
MHGLLLQHGVVVGLHPDEATDAIVDTALATGASAGPEAGPKTGRAGPALTVVWRRRVRRRAAADARARHAGSQGRRSLWCRAACSRRRTRSVRGRAGGASPRTRTTLASLRASTPQSNR